MYAQQFNVDSSLEDLAKLLQWIQSDVASYAAGNSATQPLGVIDARVRYNLNAFWSLKASLYPNLGPYTRGDADQLDALAHTAWAQLEQAQGNTAAAAQASAGAAQLSDAADQEHNDAPGPMDAGTDGSPTYSPSPSTSGRSPGRVVSAGNATPFTPLPSSGGLNKTMGGLPLWAWLAIGGGAVLLLASSRRR